MVTEQQVEETVEPTSEDVSKDHFYAQVAEVATDMIDAHGKEFAMGVLVLAARFIAEGKPLMRSASDAGQTG
jgi:hypothetical protein